MIWENKNTVALPKLELTPREQWGQFGIDHREWDIKICRYCECHLRNYDTVENYGVSGDYAFYLMVCDNCGWWVIKNSGRLYGGQSMGYGDYSLLYSSIKELDINNIQVDINQINQHLIVDFEKRYLFKPRIFEEYMGSLFRNMGHEVEITLEQLVFRSKDINIKK